MTREVIQETFPCTLLNGKRIAVTVFALKIERLQQTDSVIDPVVPEIGRHKVPDLLGAVFAFPL